MKKANGGKTLAIGIDAAEPSLVLPLLEAGDLPNLKRLLDEGCWRPVSSPASIGSGAVWPTFITGKAAAKHGICAEWVWDPEAMKVSRLDAQTLTPFWKDLNDRGVTVGVLDIPFAPLIEEVGGFQVSEWGAHDALRGRMEALPSSIIAMLEKSESHPFGTSRADPSGPEDHRGLEILASQCLAGVQARGDLAVHLVEETKPQLSLVVFPEIHTAEHHLWHTIEPEHALYRDARYDESTPIDPTLIEILRELDGQIGRLMDAMGNARVFVFSLHGMQPTRGIPTILDSLLPEWELSALTSWATQSWRERSHSLLSAAKGRAPDWAKTLYHASVSRSVTERVTENTVMPSFDWARTTAFSLPTDQNGWIRLNVSGREREGILSPTEYENMCLSLTDALCALRTSDGRRIVREVIPVAAMHGGTPPKTLPDLVVHWDEAAFDDPVVIDDPAIEAYPIGMKFTGQHARDGFCLVNEIPAGTEASSPVRAEDLHRLLIAGL